jgi:hypothetical protein
MGFLKRASERSQQAIWEQVDLGAGERPINYAHLVIAFDHYDQPGTAFLTDQRMLWRSPTGNRFEFPLEACAGWATRHDRPGQLGFGLGARQSPDRDPVPLLLYPQQPRSKANRLLAKGFFEALIAELDRVHPEWGPATEG